MQGNLFYGCGTALVTPFRGNRIDFDALENLIDGQIDADIDALVVLGTTGEPESISEAERSAIIECALARCARRVPMIVGTGANDTRTAIRRAVEAQMLGADALLVVTPYYNRASNQGLIEHYTAIADRVEIPIIMYNVPSRTGVNLEPRVVAELAKHPMLCALKDACTAAAQHEVRAQGNERDHGHDLDDEDDPVDPAAHMTDMARLCGDGIAIYSGSDECVLQALALGAHGLISVAANVIPSEMHALTMSWIRGDTKACRNLAFHWMPLINCLSSEVNPIPVKAALGMMGKLEETLRLPLAPLDATRREALRRELKRQSLIE